MIIDTVLFYFAARRLWNWSFAAAGGLALVFLAIEISFFGANALKIAHGGWFPLVVGALLFTLMTTWRKGRTLLWERMRQAALPVDQFLASVSRREIPRVKGTAIYLAGNPEGVPIALLHNLKHNKVLHERVLFLTVSVEESPGWTTRPACPWRNWAKASGACWRGMDSWRNQTFPTCCAGAGNSDSNAASTRLRSL
jgi:KUP system potassium uptake protein